VILFRRAHSRLGSALSFNLVGAGVSQPENIAGDSVSRNFLSMMGVRPFLGRDFEPDEEKSGTQRVLLLWQGI
jgi:hypothetical protein